MTLSVCLIARNEEKFLPECLRSVREVADEIILVDTGSRDTTPQIARQMGCRVFSFRWQEDFAAARNYALEQARGEWILSIDADERLLTPHELRALLDTAPAEVGGFLLQCRSAAEGGGVATTLVLRLFRRHPDIRFRGRIHEQVTVAEAGYRILPSAVVLWHEGYAQGEAVLRAKHERNLRLLKHALQEEPTSAYLWMQYARSALVLGQLSNAEDALRQALQLCSPETPLYYQILCWQAQLALMMAQPHRALQLAQQVLRRYPHQTFAAGIAAEAFVRLGQWHRAAALYERWSRLQTEQTTEELLLGVLTLPEAELAFRLGRCCVALGRWQEAEELLRHGLQQDPHHQGCLLTLAHLLLSRDRIEEADALAAQLKRSRLRAELWHELQQHRQRRLESRQRTRPLLSLSMIVRNEAHTLPACLESLREVVDEIVIVDTGSQDDTPEIARRYGARLFHFPWQDDFAAARNEALRHCTGEWVLYLDADERLHPDSAAIVRDFLQDLPADVGGVICTIESLQRREDGGSELHRGVYPRLFRNYGYPTIRFQGRVHEQISPSLLALGKQIVQSPLRILHFGYDQPLEVLQQKAQRNCRLLLRHVQEEPLNAYAWFQLGQTLARLQLLSEAEEALRFALTIGNLSAGIAASTALLLAQLCLRTRRFAEGLSWADYALHHVPDHPNALLLKAQALRLLHRYEEAQTIVEQLLHLEDSFLLTDSAIHVAVPREALLREWELLHSSRKETILPASPLSG
jgi:glycosyltransferase involved in cell wall biosynthesis/cytochrome c-type biogenesis protein CcmH/NrfG